MVCLNPLLDNIYSHQNRFKLHLQSQVGAGHQLPSIIPPLPLNKTVVEVFADFLAYLLECALRYIQDHHANGEELWASVKDQIHFVLSHPNGWEGSQQAKMRKAAVLAKLIPDTAPGRARLSFVTEGEASLHFSVKNGLPIGVMEAREGVVIVDAGGGTIDISSYAQNIAEADKRFGEVSAPQGKSYYVFLVEKKNLMVNNRPFPWLSFRDYAISTILAECVLCTIIYSSCSMLFRLPRGLGIFGRSRPHCRPLR